MRGGGVSFSLKLLLPGLNLSDEGWLEVRGRGIMGRCSTELQVFPFECVFLLMSREAANEGRREKIVKVSVKRGEGYRFVYRSFFSHH